MKIINLICVFFILGLASCYSDKGNYDYSEKDELTFKNIDESYNVIGGAENLVVTPEITSKSYGVISPNDENYEYSYWVDLDNKETKESWSLLTEGSQNIDTLTTIPTGAYRLWLRVLDKRVGVTHSKMSKLVISSTTYEGWLLFGTEGAERYSRLDMVSYISATRQIPVYDLMASRGLPKETTGAYGIGFWGNFGTTTMDRIYLMTDQAAYGLEKNEFTTSNKETINYLDFMSPKVAALPVAYQSNEANAIVTKDGDAYTQFSDAVGAKFTFPINTTVRGTNPEFKVAPFVGCNAKRPGIQSKLFVFYDVTNKRFMGWNSSVDEGAVLFPLLNPSADLKFDYKIGMDMLFMVGTAFDDGVAFAVMKDSDGDINVAGIKVNSTNFEQHSFYPKINSPKIKEATKFAFHSMFPLMYYAVESDVYCYNLGTGSSSLVLSKAGETITCIKFNLFNNDLTPPYYSLNKSDDEFMSLQYKLVVCSYNNSDDKNGGTFGLYKVNASSSTLEKDVEYKGFCRVTDVVYRERREMFN